MSNVSVSTHIKQHVFYHEQKEGVIEFLDENIADIWKDHDNSEEQCELMQDQIVDEGDRMMNNILWYAFIHGVYIEDLWGLSNYEKFDWDPNGEEAEYYGYDCGSVTDEYYWLDKDEEDVVFVIK